MLLNKSSWDYCGWRWTCGRSTTSKDSEHRQEYTPHLGGLQPHHGLVIASTVHPLAASSSGTRGCWILCTFRGLCPTKLDVYRLPLEDVVIPPSTTLNHCCSLAYLVTHSSQRTASQGNWCESPTSGATVLVFDCVLSSVRLLSLGTSLTPPPIWSGFQGIQTLLGSYVTDNMWSGKNKGSFFYTPQKAGM